jgi:hypothetical protein
VITRALGWAGTAALAVAAAGCLLPLRGFADDYSIPWTTLHDGDLVGVGLMLVEAGAMTTLFAVAALELRARPRRAQLIAIGAQSLLVLWVTLTYSFAGDPSALIGSVATFTALLYPPRLWKVLTVGAIASFIAWQLISIANTNFGLSGEGAILGGYLSILFPWSIVLAVAVALTLSSQNALRPDLIVTAITVALATIVWTRGRRRDELGRV